MASAAEQLAANFNFGAIGKAPELKQRIWFTLAALVIYRLGTYIPIPGIDPVLIQQVFQDQAGGILGMFNMFAGGALGRMTIFALNIMPYISAAIIMQLLTAVSPQLEADEEGRGGRAARSSTSTPAMALCLLASFQAYGISIGLEGMATGPGGGPTAVYRSPAWFFRLTTVVTLHRRHYLLDVAGRADHPARRRQRHLADHLRRHRRQPAAGAGLRSSS